jgi:formate dehydrogenase iron-sulfur subunit
MSDEPNALLVDISMCIGCRACMEACMERQGFTGDPFEKEVLSATNYTQIEEHGEWFVRSMCMHCLTPSCASVCPVAALQKTDAGPVVYDATRCIGCRYCMQACPFNVPRYEWDKAVPAVAKCDGCYDRIERGEINACAEACEFDATISGPRSEMLAEAHRRLREYPDEYYPHVYGENEVGGTSVLFISPVSFEELGFKLGLGEQPLPDLTMEALDRVPGIVTVGGAFLMAVWWITRRRAEVALAEGPTRLEEVRDEPDNHPV